MLDRFKSSSNPLFSRSFSIVGLWPAQQHDAGYSYCRSLRDCFLDHGEEHRVSWSSGRIGESQPSRKKHLRTNVNLLLLLLTICDGVGASSPQLCRSQYVVAVDESQTTLEDFTRAVSRILGSGKTHVVPAEDMHLVRDVSQMDCDMISINIRLELGVAGEFGFEVRQIGLGRVDGRSLVGASQLKLRTSRPFRSGPAAKDLSRTLIAWSKSIARSASSHRFALRSTGHPVLARPLWPRSCAKNTSCITLIARCGPYFSVYRDC